MNAASMNEPLAVREAPASYVLDAQRVRPGYKQTEVGVIPEDWDIRSIAQIAPLQRGFDLPTTQIKEGSYPVVYSNGVMNYHAAAMAHGPGVVTGRSGTLGKVHYVDADYWPHNTSLWVPRFNGNVPRFVYYLYTGIGFVRFASGSGVPTLNRNDAHAFRVPVPPTKAEQEAIAGALSDADALIESLEQLIAKKRHLKQGTMQELLTGKKRLPGFRGGRLINSEIGQIPCDWRVVEIGKIASVKTGPFGSSLHERDYVDDGTPIITVEHLGERGVVHNNLPMVSNADRKRLSAYSLEEGDIVFSRVGSVDRNARISNREQGWLFSGRLLRLRRIKDSVDTQFLSYQFHFEPFKQRVRTVAVGQTMASLNTQILKGVLIVLPPPSEQTAIATILSDMDTEIAALESQLAQTRSLKQGMMHNLLTGKIRLI